MRKFIVKSAGKKGKGVFAATDILKGTLIMVRDYSRLKKYKPDDKKLNNNNHVDYIDDRQYVIDKSPNSYINHSCDPNTRTLIISKNKAKNYAIKNIKKGEELTHDYSKTREEIKKAKKEGLYIWEMKCRCGSKKCKKIIRGF